MRKLPAFVLAAATALTVAGAPMTAHAASICGTGTNGANCYVTSFNNRNTGKNCGLNQIRFNKYNGQNCFSNNNCGLGQNCNNNNTSCGFGQSCSGNQGMSIVLRK